MAGCRGSFLLPYAREHAPDRTDLWGPTSAGRPATKKSSAALIQDSRSTGNPSASTSRGSISSLSTFENPAPMTLFWTETHWYHTSRELDQKVHPHGRALRSEQPLVDPVDGEADDLLRDDASSSPLKKSYPVAYFSEDSFDDDVKLHRMSMKKKKKSRQETLWIPHEAVASSPGHPFYEELERVLREEEFDSFVESKCSPYYAKKQGRPSIPPGVYFRMLLIGYFERIDSERGICWRCSDSLYLRVSARAA